MKLTTGKRFAVRTALVTSTTLATIFGAQALASLDEAAQAQPAPVIASAIPAAQPTGLPLSYDIQTFDNKAYDAAQSAAAAAPNIVILRHTAEAPAINIQPQTSGQAAPAVQAAASPLTPPNPVQVVPPAPQVAAAPAPSAPVTRSSR